MSIAVAAVVRPSRLLLSLTIAMSAAALLVAAAIAFGYLGQQFDGLARFLLFASCGFIAGFGFYHGSTLGKIHHIAISGTGQIRIREAGENRPCTDANRPHLEQSGKTVRLLPDSTLWPHLMVLRLRCEDGAIITVPVLPDCMPCESFCALAAACRWLAARTETGEASSSGKNLETD